MAGALLSRPLPLERGRVGGPARGAVHLRVGDTVVLHFAGLCIYCRRFVEGYADPYSLGQLDGSVRVNT